MITNLHIKNIGIIDDIIIDFYEGFNVLTGETGAGKTLMLDSLTMLAGERFSKEMIRRGQNVALVEACIFLPNHPLAEEGNIIVSREIYRSGRNLCKINGRIVTLIQLKEMMQKVIDIHGQNDNQQLLKPSQHIYFLDNYVGEKMEGLKEEYKELFLKYHHLKLELKKNLGDDKEKERMLDLLQYQQKEILEANLKEGEEEELERENKKLQNIEKIAENINIIHSNLKNQVLEGMEICLKAFTKIQNFDKDYVKQLENFQNVYFEMEELQNEMSDVALNMEYHPEAQTQIQERLELIFSLKRKYGNTISEIIAYGEKIETQMQEIENKEEYVLMLKGEVKKIRQRLYELSEKMHHLRTDAANSLANNINLQLKELDMPQAMFYIKIEYDKENHFTSLGQDVVEFMITTNMGEELKPLAKIASGGEISRIMLAIKVALAEADKTPIMIFDEIDTGISGIAAKAVSEKLEFVSKLHQILCVTHLAVIAARADEHYLIQKQIEDGKASTHIKRLDEEQKLEEIARISSGEISYITLEHAKALRNLKSEWKVIA